MVMYKAECSQCPDIFRARSRTALLHKIRKHIWKEHRSWMIRRIRAGKRASQDNPSLQDLVTALKEAPTRAIGIYRVMTEAQYRYTKTVMDSMEPILPIEVRASWKIIEAIHDELGR